MLGNIFFLQTIVTPVVGSNGPLWSLANEFWYYLIFPLLASIFLVPMRPLLIALSCVLLGLLMIVLPFELLKGGLIWALGAGAAFITRRTGNHRFWRNWLIRCGVAAFVLVAMALAEVSWAGIGDLLLGFAVVLSFPILAGAGSPGAVYSRLARYLSEISFTLYVTHFPLLTFMVMVGLAPVRYPPGMNAFLIFGALVFAAILFAVLLWQCFERHTDRVFETVISKLKSDPPLAKSVK